MKTKIKWFKEVLELEPSSKVFFPLARLHYEDGDLNEARQTLMQGLERNPDHLEARFLLVEILAGQSRQGEAAKEVETIAGMLSRYPSFWKVWAEHAAPASKDAAMALTFLAADFQGASISWSQVIEQGLDALFHHNGKTRTAGKPAADKSAAKVRPSSGSVACDGDANLRTRTMADLLAGQGDYRGALDIYEELIDKCDPGEDDELEELVEKMRAKLKKGGGDQQDAPDSDTLEQTVANFISGLSGDDDSDELDWDSDAVELGEPASVERAVAAHMPGKEQLLETLEALAERLEARSAL